MEAPARIAAAGLLLAAALVALVVREGQARMSGREVAVPMRAIDPRSLLTGHYVALDLTQARSPQAICLSAPRGKSWVGLRAGDGRFLASGDSRAAVLRAGADVAVKGVADCYGDRGDASSMVRLRLGVDRFHASQERAEAIERRLRGRLRPEASPPDAAVLSIGADGRARLKAIVVDGQRAELSWW